MDGSPTDRISARDKMDVLMEEYRSLRAEIVSRINNRFSILGYVGAIVTYAVFQHEVAWEWRAGFGLAAGVVLLVTWLRGMQLIRRLAKRLAAIEQRVNDLAGEPLLTWESSQSNRTTVGHLFTK